MIRNKYNGYGFDGSRLYHDPISLSIAATKAGAASSAAAAGTVAAQTAALEVAKQATIQESMRQMGIQAAKQAGVEATKQAGVEAAKQAALEATKQAGRQAAVEAGKQGIAQGFQKMIPQAADDVAGLATQGAGSSSYVAPGSTPIPSYATPAAPLPPAGGPMPPFKPVGNAPSAPELTENFFPKKPPLDPNLSAERLSQINAKYPNLRTDLSAQTPQLGDSGTFSRIASDQGISKLTTSPADELMGMKPTEFPLAPESSLAKGAREAMDWMGKNKLETGMAALSLGQYMNQPKQGEEDKDKYKNTVDMSGFQPSIASVEPFKPSYEYQKYAAEGGLMKYAVGGPVETMSAQNAVGGNMMYPQAGLQTALYSNPMMQRPESVNVISPGEGPAVGAYSGEQKFAEGGLSAAERREYGLRTRGERAARNLTKSYEEMEAEREREAMKLFNESSLPPATPIRRSRTQELSSPFSAAMAEHARLAKKNKVPVVEMPKTSLGDIDTYMDTPIEAASGGIMHGLGGYSDGGRLLRGPGDGVSDSIPAVIGKRQPARLADGEFVIPARIVSELGNGSTEAGARKLYAMMERVQNTRKKSIGKKKVAVNSKADKHLPA